MVFVGACWPGLVSMTATSGLGGAVKKCILHEYKKTSRYLHIG